MMGARPSKEPFFFYPAKKRKGADIYAAARAGAQAL
jgi:hypothetical protein